MQFRDFVPHMTLVHKDFLGMELPETSFESFDACVVAAREWIELSKVEVINFETVVLPNLYDPTKSGSTLDTDLVSSKETRTHWYQFLRVWYR